MSLTTQDISTGPLTRAQVDSVFGDVDLPFDPSDYRRILILNASTFPLRPHELSSLACPSRPFGRRMLVVTADRRRRRARGHADLRLRAHAPAALRVAPGEHVLRRAGHGRTHQPSKGRKCNDREAAR